MEKIMLMRSLCRSICRRYQVFPSSSAAAAVNHHVRRLHLSPPSILAFSPDNNSTLPIHMHIGGARSFSQDVTNMPVIKDKEIENAFKDLMAADWNELSSAVVFDVKKALSKNTVDTVSQEALKNVFRAAEAVEEFTGIIMSLKMEMDDMIGASGEKVKSLPVEHANAMKTIFERYAAYLAAFGPEEGYLKKKVEMELGSKMIYLKMRCSGLGAEWGKVTVLGTSGLSGSYVEQRA